CTPGNSIDVGLNAWLRALPAASTAPLHSDNARRRRHGLDRPYQGFVAGDRRQCPKPAGTQRCFFSVGYSGDRVKLQNLWSPEIIESPYYLIGCRFDPGPNLPDCGVWLVREVPKPSDVVMHLPIGHGIVTHIGQKRVNDLFDTPYKVLEWRP